MVIEMVPSEVDSKGFAGWFSAHAVNIKTVVIKARIERIQLIYWEVKKPRSLIGLLETTVQSETSINDTKGAKNISKISASIQDGF